MSGWQSRTAREAKNRQQEFQAANLAQRVQTDHRLRHEATWEASSRYKAQAASAQRGQTQHDCSAEEALQQRRQCLAAKLAQETEQLRQQLGQPPLALAATRRQDMLDQARARASARDARRAQVRTFETARIIATSSGMAFTMKAPCHVSHVTTIDIRCAMLICSLLRTRILRDTRVIQRCCGT